MYPSGSGFPPDISNLAPSCAAPGGASRVTFSVNKSISGAVLSAVITDDATLAPVWSDGFGSTVNSKSFSVDGLPNGDYTLTADNGEVDTAQSFTVNCAAPTPALLLTLGNITPATGAVAADGAIAYTLSGPAVPITVELKRAGATVQTQTRAVGSFSFPNVAPGSYDLSAYTQSGEVAPLVNAVVGAAGVSGCTDPEADNYDPNATHEDGSCFISPRLTLAEELPALVANGRPVWVEFNSAELPNVVPAAADAFIDLTALSGLAGVELVVNGYRLTSGPVLLATNFFDAPSLVEALLAIKPLAADYLIRLSNDDVVRLTARAEGTAYNLDITTSDAARIDIVSLPGVNRYRSQVRERWGCFVEVWVGAPDTNPSTYADLYEDAYRDRYGRLIGASASAAAPQLAQRLEMNYREDNAYQFDIAPALKQFTGHAYPQVNGSCPDRLCSFFLKFGEMYAEAGSIRRQRTAYLSGVSWALDAVEIMPEIVAGLRLLTRRPGVRRVLAASKCFIPTLGSVDVNLARETFDFAAQDLDSEDMTANHGPVQSNGNGFLAAQLPEALRMVTQFRTVIGTPNPTGAITFELTAQGRELTFANGQGGFDTFLFEGIREEITKRSTATVTTSTGSATRSAEIPEAFRLHSGLMTRAEFIWLRRELGNSPNAWLETHAGPVPVSLLAYTTEADEVLGTYTVAVDLEPEDSTIYGVRN
ncbi:hypothetical protein Q5H92_21765 [Hymenobacter sp. M29]|uniref:Carboxypeptidase regulatory-like domain-containing protein n=1 Tax=Hymenobacter mellowenesis TaxID=3063995 RepID=A0ABT9AJT4_9BACT|nr:hypothetical protein [Hymenobacter sp. M29]MDO7849007.1 hypothetical protein [Hymenobacter sp. M29]